MVAGIRHKENAGISTAIEVAYRIEQRSVLRYRLQNLIGAKFKPVGQLHRMIQRCDGESGNTIFIYLIITQILPIINNLRNLIAIIGSDGEDKGIAAVGRTRHHRTGNLSMSHRSDRNGVCDGGKMNINDVIITNILKGIQQRIARLRRHVCTMLHQVGAHHTIHPNRVGIVAGIGYNGHQQSIAAGHHTIARRHHTAMSSSLQRHQIVNIFKLSTKRMTGTHIGKSIGSNATRIDELVGNLHLVHPYAADSGTCSRQNFNNLVT